MISKWPKTSSNGFSWISYVDIWVAFFSIKWFPLEPVLAVRYVKALEWKPYGLCSMLLGFLWPMCLHTNAIGHQIPFSSLQLPLYFRCFQIQTMFICIKHTNGTLTARELSTCHTKKKVTEKKTKNVLKTNKNISFQFWVHFLVNFGTILVLWKL